MAKVRNHTLLWGGFLALGAVVVWQGFRLGQVQKINSALSQQIREISPAQTVSAPVGETIPPSGESPRPGPPGGEAPPGKHGGAREAKFRKMRELDRKQRQDAKILDLTTKLHLSPEQQDAIRAALEKGSAGRDALRDAGEQRRRSGQQDSEATRREDAEAFAAIDAAQEQAIAASLSAEQVLAYTEYQTEQKRTTIENRANQQLGDLLTRFSLTEDQKDAVFQFFARQEEENGFEPSRIAAWGGDFMALFEQRQKDKLAALKQILTPEQYSLYQSQEEQRSATFRNLIPGGPPAQPEWQPPQSR